MPPRWRWAKWTVENLEYLRDCYPYESNKALCTAFNVTDKQLRYQAWRLGLTKRYFISKFQNRLTESQLSYLAGLIDGEGLITIGRGKKTPNSKWARYRAVFRIGMTDLPTILEMKSWLESCGLSPLLRTSPVNGINRRKRDCHYVELQRNDEVLDFLESVQPFLKGKKELARAVIRFCSIRKENKHRTYRADEIELYEKVGGLLLKKGRIREAGQP